MIIFYEMDHFTSYRKCTFCNSYRWALTSSEGKKRESAFFGHTSHCAIASSPQIRPFVLSHSIDLLYELRTTYALLTGLTMAIEALLRVPKRTDHHGKSSSASGGTQETSFSSVSKFQWLRKAQYKLLH